MPFYQFHVTAGSTTAEQRTAIAASVTDLHARVTGAPRRYVHCAFTEMPAATMFAEDRPTTAPRVVGLLRSGRTDDVKAALMYGIADAWQSATGEPRDEVAVFLHEVPGANVLEDGAILPEASEDADALSRS